LVTRVVLDLRGTFLYKVRPADDQRGLVVTIGDPQQRARRDDEAVSRTFAPVSGTPAAAATTADASAQRSSPAPEPRTPAPSPAPPPATATPSPAPAPATATAADAAAQTPRVAPGTVPAAAGREGAGTPA